MPREARNRQGHGYQHLVIQSRHDLKLFAQEADKKRYLSILIRQCKSSETKLLAYCILDNHLHLVLEEGGESISGLIRRTHAEFALEFRKEHPGESGKELFRDRFRSQYLQGETELLQTVRYVHQEPVRLRLAASMEEYRWSSYRLYQVRYYNKEVGGVDTGLIKDMLLYSGGFEAYMHDQSNTQDERVDGNPRKFLEEVRESYGITDEEACRLFEKHMEGREFSEFQNLRDEEKRELIRTVRRAEGISILQLARITGVSRGIIQRL